MANTQTQHKAGETRHAVPVALLQTLNRISATYFIRDSATGLIKIGKAVDLMVRIETLQGESVAPLVLVGYVSTKAIEVFPEERRERWRHTETLLHRRFAHLRLHREWFQPAPDLLAFIAERATVVEVPVKTLLRELRAWRKAERDRWRA